MLSINKVGLEAVPVINALARSIWPIAYKDVISSEQIDYMLELMYSERSLSNQILNHGHNFIMAYDNGSPIGYASYAPKVMNNIASTSIYRLHKLYVSVGNQTKGTGRSLVDYIINDIKPAGATQLELNVNRYNKAVGFYQKIGFIISREELLDLGHNFYMDDYIMTLDF
ncbi:GNAT family N-acetyltransferase [Ferruginibacter sp. SUN002]|uniref:GNAT family N-acetyltransferase n=1 Tax=Ferruginibacter sp. SUN002 TaxID=2937789 RepID=UPI003D35F2E2